MTFHQRILDTINILKRSPYFGHVNDQAAWWRLDWPVESGLRVGDGIYIVMLMQSFLQKIENNTRSLPMIDTNYILNDQIV